MKRTSFGCSALNANEASCSERPFLLMLIAGGGLFAIDGIGSVREQVAATLMPKTRDSDALGPAGGCTYSFCVQPVNGSGAGGSWNAVDVLRVGPNATSGSPVSVNVTVPSQTVAGDSVVVSGPLYTRCFNPAFTAGGRRVLRD